MARHGLHLLDHVRPVLHLRLPWRHRRRRPRDDPGPLPQIRQEVQSSDEPGALLHLLVAEHRARACRRDPDRQVPRLAARHGDVRHPRLPRRLAVLHRCAVDPVPADDGRPLRVWPRRGVHVRRAVVLRRPLFRRWEGDRTRLRHHHHGVPHRVHRQLLLLPAHCVVGRRRGRGARRRDHHVRVDGGGCRLVPRRQTRRVEGQSRSVDARRDAEVPVPRGVQAPRVEPLARGHLRLRLRVDLPIHRHRARLLHDDVRPLRDRRVDAGQFLPARIRHRLAAARWRGRSHGVRHRVARRGVPVLRRRPRHLRSDERRAGAGDDGGHGPRVLRPRLIAVAVGAQNGQRGPRRPRVRRDDVDAEHAAGAHPARHGVHSRSVRGAPRRERRQRHSRAPPSQPHVAAVPSCLLVHTGDYNGGAEGRQREQQRHDGVEPHRISVRRSAVHRACDRLVRAHAGALGCPAAHRRRSSPQRRCCARPASGARRAPGGRGGERHRLEPSLKDRRILL
mmetsp:Transcript_46202/g.142476  ORF Transcript_46202/g.142476 Transcript_46202/m.142476 type:complete len:506 (-) Transcript_46202:251-1768(-)